MSYILTKLYVQFASSTLCESGKPGVWLKSTHVMTRQTPESVNHVTFQIFSKQQLSEMYTAAKKKKEDKVHLERRISPYLTPTTALVRPLYTHLALPSAIHRELMMPQSGRLRLYGERAGDTAREGGVEG